MESILKQTAYVGIYPKRDVIKNIQRIPLFNHLTLNNGKWGILPYMMKYFSSLAVLLEHFIECMILCPTPAAFANKVIDGTHELFTISLESLFN